MSLVSFCHFLVRLNRLSVCSKYINSQYMNTHTNFTKIKSLRATTLSVILSEVYISITCCAAWQLITISCSMFILPSLIRWDDCMQSNKLKTMSKRIKEKWQREWAGESVWMNTAVGRGQPREAHCLHIEPIVTQLAEHSKSDISPLRFQIKICSLRENHGQSKRWALHISHYQTRATQISALNNTHTPPLACLHTLYILPNKLKTTYVPKNVVCQILEICWLVFSLLYLLCINSNGNALDSFFSSVRYPLTLLSTLSV